MSIYSVPAIADYVAGDSMSITFTIKDQTGLRVNLTGAKLEWSLTPLQNNVVTPPAVLTHTTLDGFVQVVDIINGVVKVLVKAGEFMLGGEFLQELEVTLPTGEVYTVARGIVRSFDGDILGGI